ncbi:hypothetical protein CC86DRAFT_433581 [Ophiobolus disseminans]|uniref:Uncharacterized protein n=1 Tax=Ophiobolus disseminans TaxID=1469910 RepID=A0A6A6ZDW8_9PLEO|nr:hypothetical protein CC86DRAFT_433581 [Ophiobolus disseminans]
MFMAAWEVSFKEKTILKAFKATSLSPLQPELSIRSVLAEHENVRLKEALINERQRRKQGKALPLEAEEEYHGGAVFWSLRKAEEEQRQLQKAEVARLREEKKQAKAQAKQVRREARAEARIVREKEKAEKAAEQASRAAACRTQQRLQNALKATQKGNKMRPKAAAKAALKNRVVAEPQGSREASGAAAGQEPSQSRHGRAIKLLAKYR